MLRYVIEIKDEYGWIDNGSFDDLSAARKEAQALTTNFPNGVKLIDRQEAAELPIFTMARPHLNTRIYL